MEVVGVHLGPARVSVLVRVDLHGAHGVLLELHGVVGATSLLEGVHAWATGGGHLETGDGHAVDILRPNQIHSVRQGARVPSTVVIRLGSVGAIGVVVSELGT